MKKFFVVLTIIGLIVILNGCNGENDIDNKAIDIEETNENNEDQKVNEEKTEDERIPSINFSLPDGKGNEVSLSDYLGKVVLLNFWGTWCPSCVDKIPLIEKMSKEYEEDIEILSINIQNLPQERSVEGVLEWLDSRGFDINVVFDMDGSISNSYYVQYLPTMYVIDREGYVLGYIPGGVDEGTFRQLMENIIQ
ncbi:thiol-disulfide isomerase/thioredoxin [Natranaerovirga pectinivora]|uniref:Thiol-disulfide isomerase/thioredoxin n=1 Tax=Natranaerovirga pectinivora TaxID=682400 RepID=A0A4R3MKB3_9FIRM|nr:TlpA disulfide reductase family protein [Natranaerovirga pectinivora]TCT14261.1 thiol-disulfide isomerase/thioredoxin [Natranaerovirga pectinivora]